MNILDDIVAQKKREVALLPPRKVTDDDLQKALAWHKGPRNFFAALHSPRRGRMAVIAEIKKASPSAGVICQNFDPVRIAQDYEAAGATCLSVLTDAKFFQGSLDDLRRVRDAVGLPLLRKDFIIDEQQILQAAENGADAILLIVRILNDEQLTLFHSLAVEAGMTALVEVHNEAELDRALACGAELIGVNHRDLDTFKMDLGLTERLASKVAPPKLLVAESGIRNREDVERLYRAGAKAILVGETLMRNPAMLEALTDTTDTSPGGL
jgi:indole-3-glycerol phosphate synthase